jgi:CheY-like chemotaxis protein
VSQVTDVSDPAGGSSGRSSDRPLRALVVDDTAEVRALLVVNLELEGFEVREALDGQECLDVVRSWRPHVITMDVVMPRLDGLGALRALRADAATADIPVVMVSGRSQPADRSRGLELGADAYLAKPFEPAELVGVVSELALHGRRYP